MTQTPEIAKPDTDATQQMRGNLDGTRGGTFGNEYDSHRADSPAVVAASDGTPADPAALGEDVGIPPEAGRRAHIDQATGAVHGSGMGAGGGEGGEDFDADAAGGSGEK